ncbi:MAG: RNA methyltransferase [Candidatus Eremiobacteraeota bacterium]|nr:RNA methyltransferase [Candidatus Eremiobacteraeota bacterium]
MATLAGAHGERVRLARALLSSKGRKEQQRFAFEGPTLLAEAARTGAQLFEIFATRDAYDREPAVRELEASGVPVYIVDERTAEKLSDVDTPSGIVTVAPARYARLEVALSSRLSLVLAGISDPGNAGTLLRSAEAFGAQGVVFGSAGVEPYHPKVVRAAMGAVFRLALVVAEPQAVEAAARDLGVEVLGLDARGEDIRDVRRAERTTLIVGHERRGLGPWAGVCTRRVAIPMNGPTESLNAAVAGSIALYALTPGA